MKLIYGVMSLSSFNVDCSHDCSRRCVTDEAADQGSVKEWRPPLEQLVKGHSEAFSWHMDGFLR